MVLVSFLLPVAGLVFEGDAHDIHSRIKALSHKMGVCMVCILVKISADTVANL